MPEILYNLFFEAMNWTSNPNFVQQVIGVSFMIFVFWLFIRVAKTVSQSRRKARAENHVRLYNAQQKNEGHRRAGGQCEFSVGLHRCPRKSVHADHFYPYGRGGATSMQNFVASCEFHNLSKGMKMPSSVEKSRIEARRKRYFPMLASEKVGEWA